MSDWMTSIRQHPSGVLLAAQLIAVLAYPFTGDTAVGRGVLGVFGLFVLAVAVWAVRATPALTWIAITLGIPVMILTVLEALYPGNEALRLWSSILHALFYGYTAYGLVRYLFDDTFVTRDEVFAVGANFTVVAWGFAYAFMAVQVIWPGSFVSYQGEGSRTSRTCCSCPSRRSRVWASPTSSPYSRMRGQLPWSNRSPACCTSR